MSRAGPEARRDFAGHVFDGVICVWCAVGGESVCGGSAVKKHRSQFVAALSRGESRFSLRFSLDVFPQNPLISVHSQIASIVDRVAVVGFLAVGCDSTSVQGLRDTIA